MTKPCTCSHFGRTWDCKLRATLDSTEYRDLLHRCRKEAEEAAADWERDRQKDERLEKYS